jgi:chaperonin GroEL
MTHHTRLRFGDDARTRVLTGATALADAIRITLGPRSRSVLIGAQWGAPTVCDDGVTIARQLHLAEPEEDLGAQMLRQAAVRTGDAVGDGTSTSAVLAHALFADGLRNVVAGSSATELRRGMTQASAAVIAALRAMARPVSTRAEKVQVATVSAHGDAMLGELVGDAVHRVGGDGVVTVEEARATETSTEIVEGMRFDRGFLSPYFVTAPERMECSLEHPYVLLTDRRITNIQDLVHLLEELARAARPLLIVADDVGGDALATLVVNRLRGVLEVCAVKAPGFGDRRKEMLEDIAVLTAGQVVSEELGTKLESITLAQLGTAERAIIDRDTTTVVGGHGHAQAVAARIAELRRRLDATSTDYDREKLQERLAKLAGGVAVVRVGAPSEGELKQRKEAVEDAIHSTQAAVAEGIVPGGGVALARAIGAVMEVERGLEGDRLTGARILRGALAAPLRQIAANSGADPGVVLEHVLAGSGGFGFDAATGQYGDLLAAGIVDPVKVVRVALENAVSVAGTLLLAEATMTEIDDDAAKPAPQASAD